MSTYDRLSSMMSSVVEGLPALNFGSVLLRFSEEKNCCPHSIAWKLNIEVFD